MSHCYRCSGPAREGAPACDVCLHFALRLLIGRQPVRDGATYYQTVKLDGETYTVRLTMHRKEENDVRL